MKIIEIKNISELLTDKTRLAIMAELASARDPCDFNFLLKVLQVTKGNLSSHMLKIEQAGLISVHKEFVDRKPRTTYICTPKGRKELETYLIKIESILKKALSKTKERNNE